MTSTEIDTTTSTLMPYQAGLAMTPQDAKALDDQVRRLTESVLREGVDYGHIPGTNGEEKSLWRPGAQKLLQWFRLECTCDRIDIERDDDGRKHGITYRAEVGRGLKTATPVILATCEGTADYDESKFYQSAEEVQRKAEYNERKWAKQYGRVADPTKWKNRTEYRADWNALMKRAQKRAIVGAVNDATAAGGIFTDREEDDHAPPPDDTPPPEQRRNHAASQQDGDTLFQQLLTEAANLKTDAAAARITRQAQTAAKKNDISLEQEGRIQDRIQRTLARLHETATPVDVEDLARTAAPDPTRPAAPAATSTGTASSTAPDADDHSEPDYDTPGTATTPQIGAIWTILTGVFKFGKDEKDQARAVCSHIAGRGLASTKDMSKNEALTVLGTLDSWRETSAEHGQEPREFLIELMATAETTQDAA